MQFGSLTGLKLIFGAIRDWAARNSRQVEVTLGGEVLKVTGISAAQQEKIIDAWLARHTADT